MLSESDCADVEGETNGSTVHGSLEGRLRGKKVRSRNSGVVR